MKPIVHRARVLPFILGSQLVQKMNDDYNSSFGVHFCAES